MLVKAQTKKNPGEKEGRGKEGVMTEKKKRKGRRRRRSILPLPFDILINRSEKWKRKENRAEKEARKRIT